MTPAPGWATSYFVTSRIGVNVKARVIGMTETSQDNVTTREAAIGTPVVVRRY